MKEKVEVIDMGIGKGGVHLLDNLMSINNETYKETRKMYELIDRHPLKRDDRVDAFQYLSCFTPTYFGVDFSKAPDCAGRVTFWIAPFKYKTAGFNHCMIHSDFGFMWYLHNWPGLDLKDLPIHYNFEMAKKFYTDPFKEYRTLFYNTIRAYCLQQIQNLFIVGTVKEICKLDKSTIEKDILNWIFGCRMNGKAHMLNRRNYLLVGRGMTKPFIGLNKITVED